MKKTTNFFKIFELITEIFGWLQIMISPTLIGAVLGVVVYFNHQSAIGKVVGISISVLGLLIGIVWATKIFKSKKGTVWFMSRVMATPELDNREDDEDDK